MTSLGHSELKRTVASLTSFTGFPSDQHTTDLQNIICVTNVSGGFRGLLALRLKYCFWTAL